MQTTNEEQKAKLEKLIDDLSKDPDIAETVQRIEAKPETTQGHYGDYMAFLSGFAKSKTTLFVMFKALERAGANSYGLSWALKLLTGGEA